MIRAILFDLDGVLIDSEAYEQRLNARFLEEYNYKTDISAFTSIIGIGAGMDWRAILKEHMDPRDDKDELLDRWVELMDSKRDDYPFDQLMFPEVPEVLRQLKKEGYKLAVCSSSSQYYVDRAIDLCGIREYLDLAVSGHQFNRCKPFPDVYYHARDQFDLTSDECLVVEDSVNGILAGLNAGMKVVARKDNTFGMDQSAADYMIGDLRQLDDILNQLNRDQ
ncbi:MAG: HAD family phosphatase [Erysipelotrichaceae bacterium]|nr:HAD family phosphatase [Erysipelotrichaceae bacterium]MBO4537774.1 HAD family phosphatase [Erysipelotrichaceae bacterium]MBR5049353.1 HAD family phosphatase [Erysipelotrichaceae bacterium]